MDLVRKLIRDVADFPKKGIIFKDITPVLQDAPAFRQTIDALAERYRDAGITHVVGIESRGFIFGAALAYVLPAGFVVVRKPGKLPRATYSASYSLEYGEDTVQIHQDALGAGDKVVVVDDLIATGGTAKAACELVERCGAKVHEFAVVIELAALEGREKLGERKVHALLTY